VELELWADDETTEQVAKHNVSTLLRAAEVVKDVLKEVSFVDVSENMQLKETMRTLHLKEGHNSHDVLNEWNWERENDRGMLELASPCNLSEQEAIFATHIFDHAKFRDHFYPGDSFHIHVDSRCFEKDDKKLVGLLLMWEHFYDKLLNITSSRRKSIPAYASKIQDKSPELLAMLHQRWLNKSAAKHESLSDAFVRLESTLRSGRDRHLPLAPQRERDGFRNMAVNVCHLLDVKCCLDCVKNDVPKFGALEFRAFDAAFPESILFISLAERLVQTVCEAPYEQIEPLLALPGAAQPTDAKQLLEFLQLDPVEFLRAFGKVGLTHEKVKEAIDKLHGADKLHGVGF
jgi:hypothetical protein